MANFAGFDTFSYPGDEKMRSLWENTNLYWCGFYLGPRFDWSPHFGTLSGIGWGVAPIYTGKQPGNSSKLRAIKNRLSNRPEELKNALYSNGRADGIEATSQAKVAHIPMHTILYFDVENTVSDPDWLVYYRGWSRAVVDGFYGVGLYTRSGHASLVLSQLMTTPGFDTCLPTIWIAKYTRANANGAPVPERDHLESPFPEPDPSQAGGGASSWQHLGNFGMKWTDVSNPARTKHFRHAPVDFNSSIFPDPGRGFLSLIS
jgi:hypothetical protein